MTNKNIAVYNPGNQKLAKAFSICAPGTMPYTAKRRIVSELAWYSESLRDFYLEHGTLQGSGVYGTGKGSSSLRLLNRLLAHGLNHTRVEVRSLAEAGVRATGCSGKRTLDSRVPRVVPGSPSGAGIRASEQGYRGNS